MTTTYAIQEFLSVQRLTPGRRTTAFVRMGARAAEILAAVGLVPAIDAALVVHRRALVVADRWRAAQGDHAMHADSARELDAQVDRALNGLHATIDGITKTFGEREASLARRLLDALFPQGVGPLTSLTYVEQNMAIATLLERARHDFGAELVELGLEPWIARVEELNAAYGMALTRPERLTFEEVRAADAASFVAMVEVVAKVLGAFPTNSPQDLDGRKALLQPLIDQQEELALHRARRRGVVPLGEDPSDGEQAEGLPDGTLPGGELTQLSTSAS